ncbi:MAG: phosphotransferase [Vicinamibacterales bacterium]
MDTRITAYLDERGLAPRVQRVVPLTGDASDRRYFRVHLQDGPSIVLALHAGAIDVAAMPFVAVSRLLARIPLPVPAVLHHSNALGILALEDLGDVTLRHTWVSPPARSTRPSTGRPSASSARCSNVARSSPPRVSALRHCLRRREADLGAGVLRQALRRRVSGRLADRARAGRAAHAVGGNRGGAGGGTPRSVSPGLSQPQPHDHEGALHIIDFQDARMGPDTYDLASLLRDSCVDLTPGQVDELIA